MKKVLHVPACLSRTTGLLFFLFAFAGGLFGQATLTVQGVLTKSDGTAIDDGEISITFRLWDAQNAGTAVHTEKIDNVETIGGVYSVVLGLQTPITAAFDVPYFLGVSVGGGTELTPRPRLTHAPYALSLQGQNNKFPSVGTVLVDAINVAGTATANALTVTGAATAGAFVAPSGAPAMTTAGKGYSFGTGGDTDGGLFSTADGSVSLYTNGAEKVKVADSQVELSTHLNLKPEQSIKYNNISDWRLVLVDDFDNGNANGWEAYEGFSSGTPLPNGAEVRATDRCHGLTNNVLAMDIGGDVGFDDYLKKVYDLTGIQHTKIKVVYTLYARGDWSQNKLNSSDRDQIESRFGSSIDLDYYGEVYVVPEDRELQITRELILTTASNSFGIGFRGRKVGDDIPLPIPKAYYWAIDNIEVWVK